MSSFGMTRFHFELLLFFVQYLFQKFFTYALMSSQTSLRIKNRVRQRNRFRFDVDERLNHEATFALILIFLDKACLINPECSRRESRATSLAPKENSRHAEYF
jgi:hypothetical protein